MGLKAFVFRFHNQLTQETSFLDLSSTKIFFTSDMDKLLENLCENLKKNQSFFADPLFLKQLFYLNQGSLNKLLYASVF